MSNMDEAELLTRLRALIGRKGTPQRARDPVNQPTIRNWCDAIGETNPIYTDPDAAARSPYGEVVAPPSMLGVWTLAGNVPRVPDPSCPRSQAMKLLADTGYASTIGAYTEERYPRPLRLGEQLSGTLSVVEISDLKTTGLGSGYFLTALTEFANQRGEPAGTWTFRTFHFKPRETTAEERARHRTGQEQQAGPAEAVSELVSMPDPMARPAPPVRNATTRRYEEVAVGERLPPWSIDVTTRLVVGGAIATRDFEDIHHEVAAARRAGLKDLFMNVLTSNGLCGRYLGEWAGPDARVTGVAIRLGTPNVVGDTMTLSASVTDKQVVDGKGIVTFDLRGANSLGDHVKGTATLELPTGGNH
ncbi:MaoC family dehydratase N-terminal domain-containing protein [Denitratisoma sp. DHT3]|uniref:FAS1-like dehydratase domain-containing protein n=1 Tax=Denitratisoma sp. DHT3 TaxID=1981880 RepID=UPI001645B28D|nr:MaoC family dehydratase N-terminal domain-containing protein [Denitratisoma sp. DHT3]